VLADCVPSKTLIATSERMTRLAESPSLGLRIGAESGLDFPTVNQRVKALAAAQSGDIAARLEREGVQVIDGAGRLVAPDRLVVRADGRDHGVGADVVLIATGAHPRVIPGAVPDGERVLTWRQVYDLDEPPDELIVIGSGVTGAEFAAAYLALGCRVTLVSSRDRVLPGEDPDAAVLLEQVLADRGMTILKRSRAAEVKRSARGVVVTLQDGRTVGGSHALLAVGSVPNTRDLGLEDLGVADDAPRRLRGRRLHRRSHARLCCGDARQDRDVARARRSGAAIAPVACVGECLHRSRDRHGRGEPALG
jgi:dihydrolipoamide dehydrogenase